MKMSVKSLVKGYLELKYGKISDALVSALVENKSVLYFNSDGEPDEIKLNWNTVEELDALYVKLKSYSKKQASQTSESSNFFVNCQREMFKNLTNDSLERLKNPKIREVVTSLLGKITSIDTLKPIIVEALNMENSEGKEIVDEKTRATVITALDDAIREHLETFEEFLVLKQKILDILGSDEKLESFKVKFNDLHLDEMNNDGLVKFLVNF